MKMKSLSIAVLSVVAASAAFAQPQPTRVVPTSATQLQLSFASVVKRSAPAVVNIYTKRKVRNPFADDPFFGRMFGGRERVQSALGSGVIVRSDGVIVTNNHVVAGADEIVVALADRREFEATVLLADERTDLAILRVNTGGKALPTIAFHDSDNAEVGDIVLAIGNPFGLGQTVTSGIISALARTQAGVSDYQFFIQTDAAINRGNSGGALVTVDGKLIGVNSAILSRSGGNIGIGFAIPANMVKVVLNTALGGAKQVARPWLGLDVQAVDGRIAESLGLDRPIGVLVRDVAPGSPAAFGGLQRQDVITKVDDFAINDEQGLNFRATTKGVGNTATLTYLRGGQVRTASVRLATEPANVRLSAAIDGNNPMQGAKVANLSPGLANEFDIERRDGVVVTDVEGRSLAARFGFEPGDVVIGVNGRKITNVSSLQDVLRKGGRSWSIAVDRGGSTLSLTVRN
ncbi:MAG: Do family serine endopeptidase [Alphaproteobacteria bacterium]|nr:Do family serine endopeptidase [Alphaproteobacteria bacterium]